MRNPIVITPRPGGDLRSSLGVPVAALAVAMLVGAVILRGAGNDPVEAYRTMFESSLQGWQPIRRTLTLATPLVLTGLAAAVAFRMRLYNIGAEGQLYFGAIGAAGLALWLPASTPSPVMLLVVLIGGAAAGAAWAGVAAVPKAVFGTDEIITTLMLNFVALSFMNYLIFGSMSFWRDPLRPVPQGRRLPDSALMPELSGRLHYGIVIAVAAAVLSWLLLRGTVWGFQLRTIGDSVTAARYAGISVRRRTLSVLALSGGLAGLAGAVEVTGVTERLDPRALATDIGFTGIVIAAVARLHPLGVVPVAVFLAALNSAGSGLQSIGIQVEVVVMLQGLIFLTVTAGEFFVHHEVRLPARSRASAGAAPPRPEPEPVS